MSNKSILGLDIGHKRIGIARANVVALLPEPLTFITNDRDFMSRLQKLIEQHQAVILIIGLPRGLDGQETNQTRYTKEFIEKIKANNTNITIETQDEALSSVEAKDRLVASGGIGDKGQIDAEAASSILSRYIDYNKGKIVQLV